MIKNILNKLLISIVILFIGTSVYAANSINPGILSLKIYNSTGKSLMVKVGDSSWVKCPTSSSRSVQCQLAVKPSQFKVTNTIVTTPLISIRKTTQKVPVYQFQQALNVGEAYKKTPNNLTFSFSIYTTASQPSKCKSILVSGPYQICINYQVR